MLCWVGLDSQEVDKQTFDSLFMVAVCVSVVLCSLLIVENKSPVKYGGMVGLGMGSFRTKCLYMRPCLNELQKEYCLKIKLIALDCQ